MTGLKISSLRGVVTAAFAAAALASPGAAGRDGVAEFDLTIAGIPIGDAALRVATQGERYAVTATADFGFLFWGGVGEARSEGALRDGALRPERYRLAYRGVTRPGSVEIDFEGDRAVRWDREPPMPEKYAEGRLPVDAAHLKGVLDPLSALVIAAPAEASPQTLCRRVQPVFSGYTRFDLEFTAAAEARDGQVRCESRYRAVSGHRPTSRGVARMREPGALEVSLAPLAPGLWGPARVAVATRFGTLELQRRDRVAALR
jgi:hypothetical protein